MCKLLPFSNEESLSQISGSEQINDNMPIFPETI